MIASMTAFARLEQSGDWGRAIWEIRTVNHRYLEIGLRLPDDLRVLENKIRECISSKIQRGKVDCNLRYEPDESRMGDITINRALADKLIAAAESMPLSGRATINAVDILRWPGVINRETPDAESVGGPLLNLLDAALDMILGNRRREGEKLAALVLERCTAAGACINATREKLPEIIDAIRARIITRSRELVAEIDQDRLEQEMVILAQKLDVAEELDRLETHIEEVRRILTTAEAKGRRLDFLMQEMNREANTLGSKAGSIDVSNASVELKVLIEQMREQIQNIE
jgi:uncharacterized protein (TIGR00255 family)